MLCPKCKFISFDHLSVCGKCRSDLSVIGQSLRGTSANVHHLMFLGSILKSAEPEGEGISDALASAPLFENRFAEEEEMLFFGEEEPPALEFDESEIPAIDISAVEVVPEAVVLSVPEEQSAVEEVSFPVGGEERDEGDEQGFVLHEAENVGVSDTATLDLDIDESDLALETVGDELPPVADVQASDNQQGQRPLDLDEIDLSDLTHSPEGESSDAQKGFQENAEDGGFDDTMDLSLLVGEGADDALEAIDDDGQLSDLSPIDLTLVDDALVEMTVDHGLDDRAEESSGKGDGLQLSMEDGEK